MSNIRNHWPLIALPVLGISFWFLLAFPFANRNESYVWIAYLDHYSFIEIIQNQIPSIRNARPLAQAITWCLYQLSGGNIILVQIVNYSILCAAIWIMVSLTDTDKKLYTRVLYLLIGFFYISTFYYIFNLHGIFYSPILLFVALLLKAKDHVIGQWKKWSIVCLVLTFFHPFVGVLFVAYLSGCLIERYHVSKKRILLFVGVWTILFVALKLLLPMSLLSIINIQNLLGCVRNVEAHIVIKLFSLALCILTLINKSRKQQVLMAAAIAIYSPFAILYTLPFLLLLGFLIIIHLVQEKKMALIGLLAAAILFPLVVGSGAPTKAFIFIFLLPHLLSQSLSPFTIKEWIPNALSLSMLVCMLICVLLARIGVNVPVLSGLVKPILVEKGKTLQLEKCISLAESKQPKFRIQFLQQKQNNIRDLGQPKNRNYFPPTKQTELNVYQQGFNNAQDWNLQPSWYISFGEMISADTLKLIHTLKEKNCKPAYVYSKLD